MPCVAEPKPAVVSTAVALWNRKLHIYAGLYFLSLLWIFSFSGLMLNHPQWGITQFWEKRHITDTQHPIAPPAGATDLEKAQDLLRQLGLAGEIQLTVDKQAPGHFDFRAGTPGKFFDIRADLDKRIAAVKQTEFNFWGTLQVLHKASRQSEEQSRNWIMTSLWTGLADAFSLGMIFVTLSGIYMWCGKRRVVGGWIALLLGIAVCGAFLVRW